MTISDQQLIDDYKSKFYTWAFHSFLNSSWCDHPDLKWFGEHINAAFQNPERKHDGPFIFGLCGNAGTGKDSATQYLRYCPYLNGGVRSIAFADPIRDIGKIFGFTKNQMSDRKLKESVDDFWGFSPRTFMQKVGTEMFRNCLREDIWIKLLEKRINKIRDGVDYDEDDCQHGKHPRTVVPDMIFVTDVRFPNEAEAIKNMGGYIIKIRREGFSKSGENLHPSEKFIEQMEADLILDNEAKDVDEWSWYFTKFLTIFVKHDAFYDLK